MKIIDNLNINNIIKDNRLIIIKKIIIKKR